MAARLLPPRSVGSGFRTPRAKALLAVSLLAATGSATGATFVVTDRFDAGIGGCTAAAAIAGADGLDVQGTLDVPTATSNAPYTIALYESAACDASGNGEGEILLGARFHRRPSAASSPPPRPTPPATPRNSRPAPR